MRAHQLRLGKPIAQALAEAYQELTISEIAAAWDLDKGTISRWLRQFDIPTSHRKGSRASDRRAGGAPVGPANGGILDPLGGRAAA